MSRGQRVVDLGCWPGGWMQVAAQLVGSSGRVVGVDLAEIDPPFEQDNIVHLVGDIEEFEVCERILEYLGEPADVLLSDAAPKLTGIRDVDRALEERLLEAIEGVVPRLLAPGGTLLLKILECPEASAIDRRLRGQFAKAKTIKSKATRKGSTERYLYAQRYTGAAT